MKNTNHHKQEIASKLKEKLANVESGKLPASLEPLENGTCPFGYLYDTDCACCVLDVGIIQ